MDLDNIKQLWDKDKGIAPEVPLEKQNKIHTPLEIIKSNMKTEFCLLCILVVSFVDDLPTSKNQEIVISSYIAILLSLFYIVFFFTRFVKVYKLIGKTAINTNYDLFNIKTELSIAKEVYKTYYISTIGATFLFLLTIEGFNLTNRYDWFIFIACIGGELLLVYIFVKYWTYYMYGRYIDDIKKEIDELNGVNIPSKKYRKNHNLFDFTQSFLMNKFGLLGNIINTIIWYIMVYVSTLVIIGCISFILIALGVIFDIIDLKLFKEALNR